MVMNDPTGFAMLTAVKLNYQPRLGAVEVCDIRSLWHLALEFKPGHLPVSEHRPKFSFRICLIAT